MSVDKFGRYSSSGNTQTIQGQKGPKGDGFNLTDDGDYDIQLKRICNVGMPTENGDAVNLSTLNLYVGNSLLVNEKKEYDAKGYRIVNLDTPISDGDAVNKLYFTSNSPVRLRDSY